MVSNSKQIDLNTESRPSRANSIPPIIPDAALASSFPPIPTATSPYESPPAIVSLPNIRVPTARVSRQLRSTSQRFDAQETISACTATIGFLCLVIAPFLRWVNFGAGGITGIAGDGKYLLAAAIATAALFGISIVRRPLLTVPLLLSQGVGTLAVFWMGSLLWRLSTAVNTDKIDENPIGGLFAAFMVSPGAGLYCGLVGGVLVAGSIGYLIMRQPRQGALLVVVNQTLFVSLGVVLTIYIGRGTTNMDGRAAAGLPNAAAPDAPIFGFPVFSTPQDSMTAWKRKHEVTDEQWNEMVANYRARKHPEEVSISNWWEEAKSRTPAEMRVFYPPLETREWYVANWVDGFSRSRELDTNFSVTGGGTTYSLTLKVRVRTQPDVPIKEVHGKIFFVKDKKVIFSTSLSAVPDVSFTDSCLMWVKVDPYDDSNAVHRELRYAKESELTPVFKVSRVVFADGKEQEFD